MVVRSIHARRVSIAFQLSVYSLTLIIVRSQDLPAIEFHQSWAADVDACCGILVFDLADPRV